MTGGRQKPRLRSAFALLYHFCTTFATLQASADSPEQINRNVGVFHTFLQGFLPSRDQVCGPPHMGPKGRRKRVLAAASASAAASANEGEVDGSETESDDGGCLR